MRLRWVDEPRSASDSARFGDPFDSRLGKPLASTPRRVNPGRVARRLQVPFGRCHCAIHIYMAWSNSLRSHPGQRRRGRRGHAAEKTRPGCCRSPRLGTWKSAIGRQIGRCSSGDHGGIVAPATSRGRASVGRGRIPSQRSRGGLSSEDGPRRFTDLLRTIDGVSQRMLTVTLRGLERDGIVTRKVYAVVPPRVDYDLTPTGHTLLATVRQLVEWADDHTGDIDAARVRYDARPAPIFE